MIQELVEIAQSVICDKEILQFGCNSYSTLYRYEICKHHSIYMTLNQLTTFQL